MNYNTERKDAVRTFLSENAERSFSIEQICEAVLPEGRGRSTVYRIVSDMVKAGCVRKLSDGRSRHCTYQFVGDEHCREHLHFKCNGCGRIIHLDGRVTGEINESLSRAGGFSIDISEFIFGRCADCERKGK